MRESTVLMGGPQRTSRPAIALFIFALLAGVYSFTYQGLLLTTDEHQYVGAARSLAVIGTAVNHPGYPIHSGAYGAEPAHATLGSLLYRVADRLGLGVVHTLFLTNLWLTALTGVVVFLLSLRLGFRTGVAVLASLLFGLGSMAWPYTQTYFRDSLAMLLLALAIYAMEEALTEEQPLIRRLVAWVATAVLFMAGLLTKQSLIGALPGIGVVLGMSVGGQFVRSRSESRAAGAAVVIALVIAVGILWTIPTSHAFLERMVDVSRRYSGLLALPGDPPVRHDKFWSALAGMLVSPGKSVFVYSPLLMLAPLSLIWARGRQARFVGMALLIGASFAVSQALYLNGLWWSGVGWGLRSMLPTVPLLTVAALPAIEALWVSPRRWPRVVLITLIAASVAVQVAGVSVSVLRYYEVLGQVGANAPGTVALWDPYYSAILGHWRLLLDGRGVDFAWLRLWPINRSGAAASLALIAVTIGASLVGLALVSRRSSRGTRNVVLPVTGAEPATAVAGTLADRRAGWRGALAACGLALSVVTIVPYLMLTAYERDPAYYGTRDDFRNVNDYLQQSVRSGDVVVVREYIHPIWYFFMNYARWPVDWYSIEPALPGEAEGLSHETVELFQNLPATAQRVWLVNDLIASDGALRAEERWLAKHATPLVNQNFVDSGNCRVSLFSLLAFNGLLEEVGARFGEHIVLDAAQLSTNHVSPGGDLGVRLHWHVDQMVTTDYTVGLYLLDAGGVLVAQQDLQPVNELQPFNTWEPGRPVTDTHGLRLPTTLPTGLYTVVLALYDWRDGLRLSVDSAGAASLQGEDLLSLGTVVAP